MIWLIKSSFDHAVDERELNMSVVLKLWYGYPLGVPKNVKGYSKIQGDPTKPEPYID